jgi:hypothetical protein
MKNSTLIVAGTLGLIGIGAYVYLKGKKSPLNDSLGLASATPATSATSATSARPARPARPSRPEAPSRPATFLRPATRPTASVDSSLGLTPSTNDTKALVNLGVQIEKPKPTPYVAPSVEVPKVTLENIQKALLSLGIDQTRGINELASPNYIQAKKLAGNIQYLSSYKLKNTPPNWKYTQQYTYSEIQMLSKYYGSPVKNSRYMCRGAKGGGVDDCTYKSGVSKEEVIKSMTQKLNGLGYKLLPNFDIEKM